MRHALLLGLMVAACLAIPARAQVNVYPPSPPATINLPPVPLPPEQILPPTVVLPGRPPTLDEFAASFQPAPGAYEVVVMHPLTNCPVKVCFNLPVGRPCKVRVRRKELVFSYGLCDKVAVRFHRDGTATVRY